MSESTSSNQKATFAKMLAADLSTGKIELPSFPDVVIRVRDALEDENCSPDKLVRIIGAEPVLAARLFSIANSAAMCPNGDPITDLKMAVTRIGHGMVRSTAMSFALAQMRTARKLDSVKEQLNSLWERCAHVAALCFVLAKRYTKLSPDEALFVGLMHGIGEMYILVRADDHPELFRDNDTLRHVIEQWNTVIGASILDSWGFAKHICAAVGAQRDIERQHAGDTDYADVLTIAHLMYEFVTASGDVEFQLENIPACGQMKLAATDLITVLQKSDEQIRSLRQALGK